MLVLSNDERDAFARLGDRTPDFKSGKTSMIVCYEWNNSSTSALPLTGYMDSEYGTAVLRDLRDANQHRLVYMRENTPEVYKYVAKSTRIPRGVIIRMEIQEDLRHFRLFDENGIERSKRLTEVTNPAFNRDANDQVIGLLMPPFLEEEQPRTKVKALAL